MEWKQICRAECSLLQSGKLESKFREEIASSFTRKVVFVPVEAIRKIIEMNKEFMKYLSEKARKSKADGHWDYSAAAFPFVERKTYNCIVPEKKNKKSMGTGEKKDKAKKKKSYVELLDLTKAEDSQTRFGFGNSLPLDAFSILQFGEPDCWDRRKASCNNEESKYACEHLANKEEHCDDSARCFTCLATCVRVPKDISDFSDKSVLLRTILRARAIYRLQNADPKIDVEKLLCGWGCLLFTPEGWVKDFAKNEKFWGENRGEEKGKMDLNPNWEKVLREKRNQLYRERGYLAYDTDAAHDFAPGA